MNNEFWNHLLATATAIEELTAAEDDKNAIDINMQMDTIDFLYHRSFDPADAYPEYVATTLCRAINKALAKNSSHKPRS